MGRLIEGRLPVRGPAVLDDALAATVDRPSGELDLWDRLETLTDPAEFRPKLAADVEMKVFRLRHGNGYAMLANPRDLVHYQIEIREAELLHLMDGKRSVSEIVVERLHDAGDLDVGDVARLVRLLHEGGFLDPQPVDLDAALEEALHPTSIPRRKARNFLKTLMLEWEGANGFARRAHPLVRWAFTPVAAALMALVTLGGFAAFVAVQASGRYHLAQSSAPVDSLVLLGLGLVLTFAHELSHASVVVHYGRRIKSAGFMLYFGSPAFFVDVSDGLMMDRGRRILQAAAGPFSELVLAGLATISLWAFPSIGAAPLLYKFAILNYFVIFLNLVPLLELDGYWILSDLIQVPDLRPRSLEFVQHDLWHKLRARERLTGQQLGLALYGVLGIAFTVFSVWTAVFFWREIFGGLVSGLWNAGTGGRVLLAALGLFFGGPALRGLLRLTRAALRRLRTAADAVRFRVQTRWRVEAARLIDELPIFEELSEEALSDLAGRVRLRAFRPGRPVFRQGERATAFFVVRRGRVRVEDEDGETGETRTLRTLGRGESFGELGLLGAAPRAATVRAEGRAELFEVDKGTFDRLLAKVANAPDLAPTLQSLAELRALPAFSHLGSRELHELLADGRWITAAPGEHLVVQGEVADGFYAIGSGQADVREDGEIVRRLGPGDYFGELALLRDIRRTATVTARTPLRAFRLNREGFDAVIARAFHRGALKPAVGRTWEH